MTKPATLEPYRLLLFGVAAIALTTTILIWGSSQKMGRNVLKPRQFICEKKLEPKSGEVLWTVLFQQNNSQPWLRLVTGVEGDTTPDRRCQTVANILDAHFSAGLATLRYRQNPATPNRYAVCVQTAKQTSDNCSNLLILKPNIEPQRFFEQFTIDLQPFSAAPSLEDHGAIAAPIAEEQSPQGLKQIDLRPFLGADVPTD
ncbi:COP23 domain-containing protein [[Limnothrix rosea] IAM M-220]|uniref:COP23 domain-containing protein n=1 Tax=[Limnothrix rosea] IAM M-220 TaxID=454133 RepID=UPI000967C901|nr:COP23 domain-containing protein [[Limnothrix rosea] IAM M-220]OKH19269.1 hypothetical protein NIES208_03180 [[Limnothrix rosea] IAM M-220]